MTAIALTGGTGFAGRCFIEQILKQTDWYIHSLQRFYVKPYGERVTFHPWDFRNPLPKDVRLYLDGVQLDYFVHMGAEVHALRSLSDPITFLIGNTFGTFNALEAARNHLGGMPLFVYISTAEVLGGKETGYSLEDDPLRPSNPYAASKAAGELLTQTYHRCYGLPTIIVRSMNLYDLDTQTDESKFVPMVKKLLLAGQPVKIHVKNGKPGVRQWMPGTTFASELLQLLPVAEPGETYHLVGEEMTNLEMAQKVADHLKLPLKCEMVKIPKTHEHRYAVQTTKVWR